MASETREWEASSLPRCAIEAMGLHVGVYGHLGWAVTVTASEGLEVLGRRRLELFETGVPAMRVHHPGRGLYLAQIDALVARIRASARRATLAALDGLAATLPIPIASMYLREIPADFPAGIAEQSRPPYDARADAIMYREVLAPLARDRGWSVHFYNARPAERDAA